MPDRHAFITGIAGFAGSYLAEELLRAGYNVSGSIYNDEPTYNLDGILSHLRLVPLDVLNREACRNTLRNLKPSHVFHLAGVASVRRSFEKEQLTFQVNYQGTVNILDAALKQSGLRRLLFVSSADCYGLFTPKNRTLIEDQPLQPISPYGIAKAAAEHVVRYYHRQHGLAAVIARSFNHSGPRQTADFVIPAFARQVALIEAGKQKPVLHVGDLSARRDFSDVRDVVLGYRLIVEKGRPGEVYQLCSGKAFAIQTILNMLISFSTRRITITVNRSQLRKSDVPILRGSNRKVTQSVGFKSRYRLRDTLQDTLAYWRAEVQT